MGLTNQYISSSSVSSSSLSGSGNGSGGGSSATEYLYYKVDITAVDGGTNVSCDEMELNSAIGSGNLAQGTANTATAMTASTSFSGRGPELAFFAGAYGVNGWLTNGVKAGWIQWQDSGTIDVRQVAITPTPDELGRAPKDFTIQYSDDGAAFTTALTVAGEAAWSYGETRVYDVGNNGDHKYWRLDITDNQNGGAFTGISCFRPILADGSIITTGVAKAAATAITRFSDGGGIQAEDHLFNGLLASTLSGWTSTARTTETIIIHMGAPAAVKEMTWQARPSEGNRCPKDFTVSGGDTLGDMTTLLTVTGETGWASEEKRAFTIQ